MMYVPEKGVANFVINQGIKVVKNTCPVDGSTTVSYTHLTNYYKEVKEKNRVYYEYYCLDRTEEVPADYKEISFVCLRPDGCLELPTTLGTVCRKVAKTLEGFEGFHFHQLRHTYTSTVSYTHLDVYKRQVFYLDIPLS